MAGDSLAFSGSIPEHYDSGLGPVMFAGFADLVAERIESLQPMRVLETAAGTGITTRRLRDRLPPSVPIVATDVSAPMLAFARRKFVGDDSVSFQIEDATRLSLPDATFDVVACQLGAMFFPDKEAGCREAFRVLRPQGRYVFSVLDAPDFNPHAFVMGRALTEKFGIESTPLFRAGFGSAAIDPVKASLHAAGFGSIRVDVARVEGPLPDPRAFARGSVRGTPLGHHVAERGLDAEAVIDALEEALTREFGERGLVPFQAIVYEARRS